MAMTIDQVPSEREPPNDHYVMVEVWWIVVVVCFALRLLFVMDGQLTRRDEMEDGEGGKMEANREEVAWSAVIRGEYN
jgi:hypothetical protein